MTTKYPLFSNLESDFFPVKKSFSKIFQNTAHFFYLNFISKKKQKNQRNFFVRSVGREGAHYHRFAAGFRGGASQLGAPGFGTERARLVVQVERLRCTRLRHRTCKTSRSSRKALVHTASAQNVQD